MKRYPKIPHPFWHLLFTRLVEECSPGCSVVGSGYVVHYCSVCHVEYLRHPSCKPIKRVEVVQACSKEEK